MIISPQPTDAGGNPISTGTQKAVGKDEFLRLFVTKLQHQDPLNPMQDEDFIAQLAQFSSLEQLTTMNESLEESINWSLLNNQTISNSIAAQLIGNEVIAEMSEVYLGANNAPKIAFELPEKVSEGEIRILNAAGDTIRTLKFGVTEGGRHSLVWDGKDDQGERVDPGTYSIEAYATSVTGGAVDPSLSLGGIVQGVVYRNGVAYLRVDGTEIALGDVREINDPVEG